MGKQQMLSEQQQQDIVSKIKKSNTLKNAPTSSALLQYLLEATQKNTTLKEGVIDIDFFGSKEVSDKNNPRVRVNVYNLRKKLIAYYENEGKEDLWQIQIIKGQYKVSFTKKNIEKKAKTINWKTVIPYLFIGVLSSIIISIKLPKKAPSLWKQHLNSKTQTNLFIGDHFGISGTTITENTGWTRDFQINSDAEFYEFLNTHPELKNKLKPASYSYSTRMSALATQKLQAHFQYFNQNFEIRFSTQTTIPEIKEKNAIYVGPTKNENPFLAFFNEANTFCKISQDKLTINNHPSIKNKTLDLKSPMTSEEYAIVSKYKSIGNKTHFVFFSQHDIGVSATVDFFTNLDSIKKFQTEHLMDKTQFTAIFKVKGKNRTDTNLKLLEVISF